MAKTVTPIHLCQENSLSLSIDKPGMLVMYRPSPKAAKISSAMIQCRPIAVAP